VSEQERQQKIALALKRIAKELLVFVGTTQGDSCDEIRRWVRQLTTLAEEFEAGRYLPRESDAAVAIRDGEAAAPEPV
jgi:hypothetical protein